MTWRQLKTSFDAFEKILDDFAANSDRNDPNWRRNLVDLRRQLQDSLIGIRSALQTHENREGPSEPSRVFANALSSMRSAIALHQAEWPAVAIDTSSTTYRASARQLREAAKAFRETARTAIDALRAPAPR